MEKEFIVPDKCVECEHCVHEYDMWLCIHHKVDLEMVDASECEDFSEGTAFEYSYRLNNCKEKLERILKYSKSVDRHSSIERTFLFKEIENMLQSKFIFGDD